MFNHALSLVAVLTESTPFNRMQSSTHANSSGDESDLDSEEEAERDARKKASKEASLWWHVHGDALARLRAIGAYSFSLSRAIAAGVDAVQHVLNKEAAWRRHIEQVSEDAPVKKKSKGQRQQQKPEQVQSMDENGETKRIENEFVFSSQVTRRSIYSQIVAAGVKEFVSKHAVAAVTLDRALELRTQLLEKCVQVLGPLVKTDNEKGHGPPGLYSNAKQQQVHASARSVAALSPPTSAEESALRQLLAASFCDNIARKIPAGMIQKGSRRTRLTAYVSANPAMPGTMYIHPQSALYSPDPTTLLPEFIVYDNLVRNERGDQVYMSVVSAVKSSWLVSVLGPASDNKGQPLCPACPLLKLSAPLASPSPFYDRSADEIVCYVVPTYGNHKWELAPQKRPMYACFSNQIREKCTAKTPIGFFKEEETYRWFARLLLEGRVSFSDTGSTIDSAVSKNLFNVSQCREPPTAITDMRPVPRVTNLLRVLANDGVRNKRLLLEKIRYARENKECYLSEELLAFMHVEHRKEFKKKWIILCESI